MNIRPAIRGTREYIRYPETKNHEAPRGAKGCDALCAQIIGLFSPWLTGASDGQIIGLQDRLSRLLTRGGEKPSGSKTENSPQTPEISA